MSELSAPGSGPHDADGLARARELGVQVNIAIVDGAGHLLSFSRMDEAMLGSIDVALKKARTARPPCRPENWAPR